MTQQNPVLTALAKEILEVHVSFPRMESYANQRIINENHASTIDAAYVELVTAGEVVQTDLKLCAAGKMRRAFKRHPDR